MPVGLTGHAGAVGVNFLMTTHTIQPGHALAIVTAADDVSEMAMAVIPLLRIVCRRVTVDAAR
jgi:hypothetical protein